MNRSYKSFAFLAVFACAMIVAFSAIRVVAFWARPAQAGPAQVIFYEVKPHMTPYGIAKDLEKLGVVSNARWFYLAGRFSGRTKKFKAGDYRFTTAMYPGEVMSIIISGMSFTIPVTVVEGYNLKQISEVIDHFRRGAGRRFYQFCSNREFIEALGFQPAPATLEGYLFPDTYLFTRKITEEDMIRQMVKHFRAVFTPELLARSQEIGMSEHQVVTLASIIEKETGADNERPLVSSVFHNRLKKGMRLQTDPTVIYGIKNYNGNLTRKDLATPTPYNTYTIRGLPPGPIANPGKASILAALNPAQTDYLFFVSHNDGTHEFTSTLKDHERAVTKFQLDPKAREGKSWRDLKKRQRGQPQQTSR